MKIPIFINTSIFRIKSPNNLNALRDPLLPRKSSPTMCYTGDYQKLRIKIASENKNKTTNLEMKNGPIKGKSPSFQSSQYKT